jgi:uncharacterized membrane-anchored protein
MIARMKTLLGAAGLVLVLGGANYTVWDHERTLAQGQAMYLALAPVDPRSLMQGDFMALNFALGARLPPDAPQHGRMVVKLDERRVAEYVRLHAGEALAPGEALLEYRLRNNRTRIVTDAWFFEEGRGDRFAGARFGELRVRADGQALLVGMADAALAPMGAGATGSVGRPRP